ncbi:HAD family hydrolase [Candidatus Woesebacteria bacterium]|nr:HAD family hydrolase [Candidatus Woesebacteria bacterium]
MQATKIIFFDLDGTLWSTDGPELRAAWDRLPVAWQKVVGKLPDDFDWKLLAGSTDAAVVRNLVHLCFPDYSSEYQSKISHEVLKEMNQYYLYHAPDDLTPALFPDSRVGLEKLVDDGWTLGIVTGNTRIVGEHKLRAAGLDRLFSSDPQFQFYGDDAPSRWKNLMQAWENSLAPCIHNPTIPPLIYVADTYRDYSEMNTALAEQSTRFLYLDFRFLVRLNPAMYPHIREIQRDHSSLPYVETQFFEEIGDEHFNRISIREGRFPWRRGNPERW